MMRVLFLLLVFVLPMAASTLAQGQSEEIVLGLSRDEVAITATSMALT